MKIETKEEMALLLSSTGDMTRESIEKELSDNLWVAARNILIESGYREEWEALNDDEQEYLSCMWEASLREALGLSYAGDYPAPWDWDKIKDDISEHCADFYGHTDALYDELLRFEGHKAWQPHFAFLRNNGHWPVSPEHCIDDYDKLHSLMTEHIKKEAENNQQQNLGGNK